MVRGLHYSSGYGAGQDGARPSPARPGKNRFRKRQILEDGRSNPSQGKSPSSIQRLRDASKSVALQISQATSKVFEYSLGYNKGFRSGLLISSAVMLVSIAAYFISTSALFRHDRSSAQMAPPTKTAIPDYSFTLSDQMDGFFQTFDRDGDGFMQMSEARRFNSWVDRNIRYRYDNEGKANPRPGLTVGDGRPGIDYRQSPEETYAEREGDCEDFATLYTSYFLLYGETAYTVGSKTHAYTILRMADDMDGFVESMSKNRIIPSAGDKMVFYSFDAANAAKIGAEPGIYSVIDQGSMSMGSSSSENLEFLTEEDLYRITFILDNSSFGSPYPRTDIDFSIPYHILWLKSPSRAKRPRGKSSWERITEQNARELARKIRAHLRERGQE
jgi:hypothetical protein